MPTDYRVFPWLRHMQGQHDQHSHAGMGGITAPDGGLGVFASEAGRRFIERGENVEERLVQQSAKMEIREEVGSRLVKDPLAKEAFRRFMEDERTRDLVYSYLDVSIEQFRKRSLPLKDFADKAVKVWSETAGDSHHLALSMQLAAAKEFGLENPKETATRLSRRTKDPKTVKEAQELANSAFGILQRRILRHMYEHTQEELKKAGIEEMVLHRGVTLDRVPEWSRKNQAGPVKLNPISSFTVSYTTAGTFSSDDNYSGEGRNGVLYTAKVPRERILSTARTGFGCLPEYEYTVLGGGSVHMRAKFRKYRKVF